MPVRTQPATLGPCPICGRPLIEGPSIDRHHWIPRSKGGSGWSTLHRICHKKIHSLFSEDTLAKEFSSAEALLAHPDIQTFVKWVRKQPPELIGRHAKPNRRRG
ncbi:HNH endonuclease [Hwanghaeella grinnelliae]|uniref:HNH endonuclease n=1 Tax=Hwanghaeella grinnelliae TaxID=2500179 RepID=A0A3S2ZAS1_9PROT|nr:HNH endonuclease signature motif containing protein [Hwanghaeella grinnelliae]RVU38294.1 HNH endonuclease [Hwanghaeella grinnelliae]